MWKKRAESLFHTKHISPTPEFILTPHTENEMTILALEVQAGRSTPYYYVNKGTKAAYIHIGNESNLAPDYILTDAVYGTSW